MDIIYPVRPGENEELRHSLRSLGNLPMDKTVWITGDKPDWVTNVNYLKGNKHDSGQRNQLENLLQALEHPDMGEQVIIMNDDFYITQPTPEIPNWYRGTLTEHINMLKRPSWWKTSLTITNHHLNKAGIKHPLSYELHKPFKAHRSRLIEAIIWCLHINQDRPPQWRTAYGNLNHIGGQPNPDDGKIKPGTPPHKYQFLSSSDQTYPFLRQHLETLFPNPSTFEHRGA